MEAGIAIQVLPGLQGNDKVIAAVDKVIEYIESTGLSYFVGPFETTVEGSLDELMEVIKQAQIITIEAGAPSVMSYVKINYNPKDGVLGTDEKISKHHK